MRYQQLLLKAKKQVLENENIFNIKGFRAGAEWMHTMLQKEDANTPGFDPSMRYPIWGSLKYLVSFSVFIISVFLFICYLPVLLPLSVFIFYGVEIFFLFLFPLLIDRVPRPFLTSIHLTCKTGICKCMVTVMPIGLYMVLGIFNLKSPFKNWYVGCTAILLWYLEDAKPLLYQERIILRKEIHPFHGKKTLRIMYLSDLHLKKSSGEKVTSILLHIHREKPDIILFGGDYIDTPAGWKHFNDLLQQIGPHEHLYSIYGNHDLLWKRKRWEALFYLYEVTSLHKKAVSIKIGETRVTLHGILPRTKEPGTDLSILCLHRPYHLHHHVKDYDFVLAGHLHGGQVVWWQNKKGLYPARLFYRFNFLKNKYGTCTYLVSRGLGDTLPLRFHCPKEIVMIECIPT